MIRTSGSRQTPNITAGPHSVADTFNIHFIKAPTRRHKLLTYAPGRAAVFQWSLTFLEGRIWWHCILLSTVVSHIGLYSNTRRYSGGTHRIYARTTRTRRIIINAYYYGALIHSAPTHHHDIISFPKHNPTLTRLILTYRSTLDAWLNFLFSHNSQQQQRPLQNITTAPSSQLSIYLILWQLNRKH